MTRILISPVGQQDPYSEKTNEEGSIVTICRAERPDLAFLLPTAERADASTHTAQNARDTVDILADEVPTIRCHVRPLDVSDPTDYTQVVPEVDRVIRGILDEIAALADPEIILNGSSATPQIKVACLMLAATGALACRVLQVANPETMTRESRLQEVDVAFIQERQVIERVRSLYRRHLFAAGAAELRGLAASTYKPDRRTKALAFAEVCEGYSHLDQMQYHHARQSLERAAKAVRSIRDFGRVEGPLRKQVETLVELDARRDSEDWPLLADVYHNALRRLDDGSYVDAITRAWRIVEGCLREHLRRSYGVEPTNLARSVNRANRSKLGPEARLSYAGCVIALESIYLDEGWRRWARKSPGELRARGGSLGGCVESLRVARNESVAGHGARPVSRELAVDSLTAARLLIQLVFGKAPDDSPFVQARLTEVADIALGAM